MVQLGEYLDLPDQIVLDLDIYQLVFLIYLDGHKLTCLPMLSPPHLSVASDPKQTPVLFDLVLIQVPTIRARSAELGALEL